MPAQSFDIHRHRRSRYQFPDAPPPPKLPPPPLKPPPPEPPPQLDPPRPPPPPDRGIASPISVKKNAMNPAMSATAQKPTNIQATMATPPPVSSEPGNRPKAWRKIPPITMVRIRKTGKA